MSQNVEQTQAEDSIQQEEHLVSAKHSKKHFSSSPESTSSQNVTASGDSKEKTPEHSTSDAKPTKHRLLKACLATVCLLGVAYGTASYYFTTHLMYGTYFNDYDVSFMDKDALAQALLEHTQNYQMSATKNTFSLDLTQDDIAYQLDHKANAAQAIADHALGYMWPKQLLSATHVTLTHAPSFSEAKLKEKVAAAVDAYNQQATNPADAYSQFDEASGVFKIFEEKVGTALSADEVTKEISQAIQAFSQTVELSDACLQKPSLKSTDPQLKAINDKANQALALSLSVTYGKKEVAQISKTELSSWMHIASTSELAIDQSAVEAWGQEQLLPQLTSDDSTKKIKINYAKLTEVLNDRVNNLSSDPVALVVSIIRTTPATAPAESEGARERGRHIDINIANQYARLYDEDGDVLWQSWLVSGGPNHTTPAGTFRINAKMRNQTLIGEDKDKDGEPDYKSHVDFWMPFVGNMVGLHDASWRGVFGGKIYQWGGSHGCVNLPPSKARELFDLIHVGDKVYVH